MQRQVLLQSKFLSFGESLFLAVVLAGFSFSFTLGFDRLNLSVLVFKLSDLYFSFCHWSKFWLILASDYLASLLVKSVWRRFFSSVLFVVGFLGFLNWLHFFGQSFW